jgi:polysulfide reductase-like protein
VSPRREATVVPDVELRTYYGEPVLKEPVWKWEIPAYLFTGGLAAGSSLVAAAADLAGDDVLARRMEQVALGAAGVSGVLLVTDLGQPKRFHHMLRVLKPTSPMNLGAWLLGAFSAGAAGAVAADQLIGSRWLTRALRLATAAVAPAIASYTAVLLADTAIPAWHDAHRELPFVFVGGAAASAAGLGLVLVPPDRHGGLPALLVGGAALELFAARVMERQLDRTVVGRAYGSGRARVLSRVAQVATVAGGAVAIAGRRRRAISVAGGLVGLVGAIAERYAIVDAGRASARDPFAVVEPQRARMAEAGSAR